MKLTNRWPISILVSVLVVMWIATSSVNAGEWNTNEENVVLEGYDLVAYQLLDKPVKGNGMFRTEYDGVIFHFSSAENQKTFADNPEKYLPKYNGYCAFAVAAKNAKVPANPDSFKLYNGELLVFFNDDYEGEKFNTKIPWNADEKLMHFNAEKNWATLSK